jgi:hypothetical protein
MIHPGAIDSIEIFRQPANTGGIGHNYASGREVQFPGRKTATASRSTLKAV